MEAMDDMNRIKVVLVEKKKTSKWLAGVATLREIARVLDVDVKELLNSTK